MPNSAPTDTHWPRIILLWLCGVAAAMQFAKISIGFQDFLHFYQVSAGQLGFSLSIVGMIGLVFGVTAGVFAHAIGYRRLLLIGLGLGSVLAWLQTLLLPFPWFFASRLFEGFSHLIIIVVSPILITTSSARKHRSITMGLWSTFFGVAFASLYMVGPWLLAHFSVQGLLCLHAVCISAMWLLVRLALRDDALDVEVRHLPKLSKLFAQHVEVYKNFSTVLPGVCFLCYTATSVALMTFVPQFAGEDAIWLAILLPLMSTLGTFCAGWIAQYWLTPLRLISLAFVAVALAGVALFASLQMGIGIAPAALTLLFMGGVTGGSAFSLIPHLNHDKLSQMRANAALAQLANVGSTMGPPLFASLIVPFGIVGVVTPLLGFCVLGLIVSVWAAQHLSKISV